MLDQSIIRYHGSIFESTLRQGTKIVVMHNRRLYQIKNSFIGSY